MLNNHTGLLIFCKYTKNIPYGYLELAGKMWFPEEKQVSYSNAGDNEQLQEDVFLKFILEERHFR